MPMHKVSLHRISALDALSCDSANALTGVEEAAVEKVDDHALDRPVRVMHLICLLHHRIFMNNM